jgi:hypothetical protein
MILQPFSDKCPTLCTALLYRADRTMTNKKAAWPTSNYKSKNVTSCPDCEQFFFLTIWNMVPVTLPCFIVRKFVYQVISIRGKEMCPPNCYTAEYIRGILSSLARQNHPEKFINTWECLFWLLLLTQYSEASTQKQTSTDNPLHFLKLAVTVRCNFEGIFSSSNCPDQHQGPPSLPLNQYWGS